MGVRSTILLVVAVVSVALVAGCGGGDDDSSAAAGSDSGEPISTSSLSKAEFVKQASAACRRERSDLLGDAYKYLGKKTSSGTPQDVAVADLGRTLVVPTVEAEAAAIRKLGAPAGDEEEIEEILAAQQEGIDEVKALKKADSIEVVLEPFADANKKLREYGFTACFN